VTDGGSADPSPDLERAVEEQVRDVEQTVEQQAERATEARAGAEDAQAGAQQAEAGARAAGSAAVEAARLVAPPEDPVLDTELREIEARVDEGHPFGVPGRPLSRRSPFRIAVPAAQAFAEQAPEYIRQLQENDRIASLDARLGLLDRAERLLEDPERIGVSAAGGVLGVGKVVFGAFFGTLTVLVVTLYFLANLPGIKSQAYRLVPRSRRARVGLLTDEILSRVGGYVAGAVSIAGLSAGLTFVLLRLLGIEYAVALAMLVFLTGLIPLIGATLGALVVTTVALFTSVQAGIVVAVYFLVYQQVENYLLYPRIMQRSVSVSPAATVVAVLIGGSLLGVLGALLAIPLAAAVQLVVAEVLAPRQDTL
jgi:predicted PurR-regulated permease PerM